MVKNRHQNVTNTTKWINDCTPRASNTDIATDLPPACLTLYVVLILTSHMCKPLTSAANPLSSLAAARQRPTKPDVHTTPEPRQTSSQLQTNVYKHHQNQPFAMPKPDKHVAASQAVDILEEISTMLVRIPLQQEKSKENKLIFPLQLELPHGPPHAVHMHLINRTRRPSRISRGKQASKPPASFEREPSFQSIA